SGSTAAEVVEDGVTGQVVAAGDPERLAAALLAAAGDPHRAAAMAGRAVIAGRRPDRPAQAVDALTRLRRGGRHVGRSSTRRPLVSVVVPVRDQGEFVQEAIDSVRASGHEPLEIVVVDDGSTDPDTVRTLDALDGVTLLRQEHRGLPAARNAGIAASNGPYVLPLDADDRVAPGFVPGAVAALERNSDLGLVTGYVRNFGLLDSVFVPLGHVPELCLVMDTYARATGLFRRDALERVGGYDEALPATEDWDLYIRLARAGCASDVLPIVGQHYRRHRRSMTFTMGSAMRVELIQNLLRRHADMLGSDGVERLLHTLVYLWKTGYEPSASAALLHRGGGQTSDSNTLT
ncbi:MAG TPA: glycosyltransferase family A protein, partial [Candidatus Dormibacteraeota bacterium]|nr:glycosyltransferase family A protein [Candidatus Dormibacteraeota bacterium]